MKIYGLIGHPLSHSFSQKYFTEKFIREGIPNSEYHLFDLSKIEDFVSLIKAQPSLEGLNVTIPYKEKIIPYLNSLDESASQTGAVNVIKVINGQLIGFNSDAFGFAQSLKKFLPENTNGINALVLGSGGASKAVIWALKEMNIDYKIVSRNTRNNSMVYQDLNIKILKNHKLIINTTPLGMYPNTESFPPIPFAGIDNSHFIFDLVYNPQETSLMKQAIAKGAKVKNGLEMLHLQAEKAWEIWNK